MVHTRFHAGAEVTLEDAQANIEVTAKLTGGRALPVLVDLRTVRSQSAEARSLFAGPEGRAVSSAVALLLSNPLSRVMGNFYLGFNRPQTPTRLFTSEAEAEAWLLTFAPNE
jgi:hypothetical protein